MSVKQKCPEFENHERWLVSYADMLTLLFAVFVVLYSQAIQKQSTASTNVEAIAGSLQESFNTPLEDIPLNRKVGPKEQGFGIFEHMRGNQIRPPLIQKYPGHDKQIKVIESEMNQIRLKLEDRLYGQQKNRGGDSKGYERVVSIERTKTGFKLSLASRYFFGAGEVNVRREALKELEQVGVMIKDLGRPILIEGHTDSMPSSSQFNNWEISTLRAANVAKYLAKNVGFPSSKISLAGYADTKPIASNNTESGRSMNRRIEIQVQYDPDQTVEPSE